MIPAVIQPDTDLMARVATALVEGRVGSLSPGMSNDLTLRSFAVEKLASDTDDPQLKAELEKFAIALRTAGEYSFAHGAAVLTQLGRLVEGRGKRS